MISTIKKKLALLLMFLFASILLSGCFSIKPVVVTGVKNFRPGNLLQNPEFSFDLGVKNPNSYGVTVKRMGINVLVADSSVGGIKISDNTRIAGKSAVQVPVKFQPSMSNLTNMAFGSFKNLFSAKGSNTMEVKGEIVISKFIFSKKIKFSEKIKL